MEKLEGEVISFDGQVDVNYIYKIGQVSKMLDIKLTHVRYISDQLSTLLEIERKDNGDRQYTQKDIKLLERFVELENQGFKPAEARKIIMTDKKEETSLQLKNNQLILEQIENIRELKRDVEEIKNRLDMQEKIRKLETLNEELMLKNAELNTQVKEKGRENDEILKNIDDKMQTYMSNKKKKRFLIF